VIEELLLQGGRSLQGWPGENGAKRCGKRCMGSGKSESSEYKSSGGVGERE